MTQSKAHTTPLFWVMPTTGRGRVQGSALLPAPALQPQAAVFGLGGSPDACPGSGLSVSSAQRGSDRRGTSVPSPGPAPSQPAAVVMGTRQPLSILRTGPGTQRAPKPTGAQGAYRRCSVCRERVHILHMFKSSRGHLRSPIQRKGRTNSCGTVLFRK